MDHGSLGRATTSCGCGSLLKQTGRDASIFVGSIIRDLFVDLVDEYMNLGYLADSK